MELNEALKTLNSAGFITEAQKDISFENAKILSQVFDLDEIVEHSQKGEVTYVTLGDGDHDVYVIAEYHNDTDTLNVKLNYGKFRASFKDFACHAEKDDWGRVTIDDELDSWVTDVMSEWTDAFGY